MTQRQCSICLNDGIDPPGEGQKVYGSRWHEGRQRYVVFNGYACQMHLKTFKTRRFPKSDWPNVTLKNFTGTK